MKTLILFRHGKSDWNAKYRKDYERPLAKRGILASKKMGIYLAGKNQIPDMVISSPSNRTYNTAKLAIEAGNWGSVSILSNCLYLTSQSTILSLLSKQKNEYSSICIVGHEPSLSSFIENQTSEGNVKYPTGTMAMINFDIDYWCKMGIGKGILKWLKRPKEIL